MNTTPTTAPKDQIPDAKWPYFINPAVEALKDAGGEHRMALVRLIAANIGDETTLRTLLGLAPEEFVNFYPDMLPPSLSTDDTIDNFINRFSSQSAARVSEIEEIVAAPVVDYTTLLATEESASDLETADESGEADATTDAISAFLAAVPPKAPTPRRAPQAAQETSETTRSNGSELSEALFKLMVKNKNYRKALEIINELSLKNPKKSIYFAYQTRFLEKLIKNQENTHK